jgi:hypothetical protein
MSWSVSASGKPAEVKAALDSQFAIPLRDPPAGLTDDGERETVLRIRETIAQCLETFGPNRPVIVIASGHQSFDDYATKAGACQTVSISIQPSALEKS